MSNSDHIHLSSAGFLSYLERYVNDGSPSGFTDKFTTSSITQPSSNIESFELHILSTHNLPIKRLGETPNDMQVGAFYLHPDMVKHQSLSHCKITKGPSVTPTSSARTVRLLDKPNRYIKLSYDGLIGRVLRTMSDQHIQSAIEVSSEIKNAIDNKLLPDSFRFLLETYGETVKLKRNDGSNFDWGYIIRDADPYRQSSISGDEFFIPAFSLWSKLKKPNAFIESTLLDAILLRSGLSPWEFIIERLIYPLVDCYFELLISTGLQLEAHSQNVLFGFNINFQPVSVCFRDAESIDKDLDLMERQGISNNFQSLSYKCLKKTDYNYQIMHSFMYDFKMGEYLITPLINELCKRSNFPSSQCEAAISLRVQKYIAKLPVDFFPSDRWYFYSNIIHKQGERRPYQFSEQIKYR